jgi:arsenate reductase-like glutaredoxin family protein
LLLLDLKVSDIFIDTSITYNDDKKSKGYANQYIIHLSSQDDVEERLLANPGKFITPIVRDGEKATVGYEPNVWAGWIA